MGLDRFVQAQAAQLDDVERELTRGRKVTHWMWYVFPQLKGLGFSATARFYAIENAAEAADYLAHAVLGPRLRHHTELVIASPNDIDAIFGYPDNLKFHSCMTLFDHTSSGDVFARALQLRFGGRHDERTIELLRKG